MLLLRPRDDLGRPVFLAKAASKPFSLGAMVSSESIRRSPSTPHTQFWQWQGAFPHSRPGICQLWRWRVERRAWRRESARDAELACNKIIGCKIIGCKDNDSLGEILPEPTWLDSQGKIDNRSRPNLNLRPLRAQVVIPRFLPIAAAVSSYFGKGCSCGFASILDFCQFHSFCCIGPYSFHYTLFALPVLVD
jgi:hypothetical protein